MSLEEDRLVQPARVSDAPAIRELLAQLRYTDEIPNVSTRLKTLLSCEDTGLLVAELAGQVSALAAYQLMQLLERHQPQCRITTLVVHADARRQGLARSLLERVATIAAERGCFRLEVTTQAGREDAARLYLALGFEERPRRLVKALPRA